LLKIAMSEPDIVPSIVDPPTLQRNWFQRSTVYVVCGCIGFTIQAASFKLLKPFFSTDRRLLDSTDAGFVLLPLLVIVGFAFWKRPSFATSPWRHLITWALKYSLIVSALFSVGFILNYINAAYSIDEGEEIQTAVISAGTSIGGRGGGGGPRVTVEDWRKPGKELVFRVSRSDMRNALNDNRCMFAQYGIGRLGLAWISHKRFAPCDSSKAFANHTREKFASLVKGLPAAVPVDLGFLAKVRFRNRLEKDSSPYEKVTIKVHCRLRIDKRGTVQEGYCQSPPYPSLAGDILAYCRKMKFQPPVSKDGQSSAWTYLGPLEFELIPHPKG
jgi:hypothetical protein